MTLRVAWNFVLCKNVTNFLVTNTEEASGLVHARPFQVSPDDLSMLLVHSFVHRNILHLSFSHRDVDGACDG